MARGSCLCGALGYEVAALASAPTHCHCRTCQKAHSAAFATTARVRREDFRWTGDQATLGSFESTPGKLRHFCTRCGSHLMAEWVALPQVILRVASLNGPLEAQPVAHIWVSHQAPWDKGVDELPRYPEGAPIKPG